MKIEVVLAYTKPVVAVKCFQSTLGVIKLFKNDTFTRFRVKLKKSFGVSIVMRITIENN